VEVEAHSFLTPLVDEGVYTERKMFFNKTNKMYQFYKFILE